ncbi:MAG: hypothetical protein ACRET5_03425, partial [Steroidobacteraceae bacterium]
PSRTTLLSVAAAALLCAGGRCGATTLSKAPRTGFPYPPAECSVYVGYDRDAVLPGYRLRGSGGAPMCVPFATTAAHPPRGYQGDFYVSEFTDAKLRERWQACRADPPCFKRIEAHIQRRLPPNVDRKIRSAQARYLLGAVDQDDDGLPLSKIRRPAFFGLAPWREAIAKAEPRTYTIELSAGRGPYDHLIMHLSRPIELRGWYLRGAGVPDGRGHLTRALIIMSNGGGGHLVAIEAPHEPLYHVDPKTGKSVWNHFPSAATGAGGQRAWRDLLYQLNEAGFDVLSYDRRGIGISGGYCDTNTLQQGRDLLNVAAALPTGAGIRVLTPDGRIASGLAAAKAIFGGADAARMPVFLGGDSRGTMAVGWAMTRNFYRACDYDMPQVTCRPPRRLPNIRGAIQIGDFSAGIGYLTAPTQQDDSDRGLYTAGTETQYHIVFFPSSEVLAGIHTWPALIIARGAWDYAESLESAIDVYERVQGPKDLVVIRGPHTFEVWPRSERARVAARIAAFARAVVAGRTSVPDAAKWSNMKQLLATAPDDGWR